jgi:5-methylcytosine-specific restriction protein A
MWGFVVGQTYNRRRDIHQKFGGQRQGGISTPAKHRVVFIFTGPSGVKHGYSDEWSQDGTYRYYGEGQRGDMTLQRGNRAIANHAVDGNDLLLFRTLGRGQVRFLGPFNCAGYRVEEGRDSTGVSRRAIVFDLASLEDEDAGVSEAPLVQAPLNDLRRLAFEAAGPARQTKVGQSSRSYYVRSETVRQYVLARRKEYAKAAVIRRHSQPKRGLLIWNRITFGV